LVATVLRGGAANLVQNRHRPVSARPVYADAETANAVSSWRVVLEAVEREPQLSDHAPIEVILAD
jgi:hypothetical protein